MKLLRNVNKSFSQRKQVENQGQFLKTCQTKIMDYSKEEYNAALEEWSEVQEIIPTFSKGEQEHEESIFKETPLIPVDLFIEDFRNSIDLDQEINEDESDQRPILVQAVQVISWLKCCTQSRLNPALEEEKKLVFAISKRSFNDDNPMHFQVLLTLYKLLTGSKIDCPRYGSHWEQIGFQGNDPATDLRGVGCLGLLQPLYLVMTPELLPLAKDIYKLSLSENQNFPLMVLSINVSRIALHALRDGVLNRQSHLENSVWSALNFFYVAILFHIYTVWKNEYKSIKDSGYVLKDAEKFCRKNVRLAIQNLNNHLISAYSIHEKQLARENIQSRQVKTEL